MEKYKILKLNTTTKNEVHQIFDLYKIVSKNIGGLARTEEEITFEYINNFVEKSSQNGVQFIAIDENDKNKIIGEIHCYKLEAKVFSHILSELTIAVDPMYQGMGIGKSLFANLLNYIKGERQDIYRIELIARESNLKAIELYKTLGFVHEGKFENRIRIKETQFEADMPMAWFNPNFIIKK